MIPDVYTRVAEHLKAFGKPAEADNTGGGCYCVLVPDGPHTWYFGTGGDTWAGDLLDRDGYLAGEEAGTPAQTIDTGIDAGSEDSTAIALAIADGLRRRPVFVAGHACPHCGTVRNAGEGCPCPAHVIDVLSRTVSVLDTQIDENGEPLREGNADLYRELRELVAKLEAIR